MACTCVGLLSLLMALIAVVFSGASAGLPLWTMLGKTNNGELAAASFTAGVWGYCTDVSFTNTGAKLDTAAVNARGQCYLYYSANTKVHVNLNNDPNNTVVLPNQGVCATYAQDKGAAAQLYSTVVGLDLDSFEYLLNATCGTKGKLSLAFSMLSPIFGFLGTLMLALGICCAKNRSCLIAFALFMTLLGGVWALVSCIVWSQQLPSGNGLTYGISYYLEIAAVASYAIAVFFLAVHMTQGHSHKHDKSNSSKAPIKLQEALEKHKKIATGKQPTRLV